MEGTRGQRALTYVRGCRTYCTVGLSADLVCDYFCFTFVCCGREYSYIRVVLVLCVVVLVVQGICVTSAPECQNTRKYWIVCENLSFVSSWRNDILLRSLPPYGRMTIITFANLRSYTESQATVRKSTSSASWHVDISRNIFQFFNTKWLRNIL